MLPFYFWLRWVCVAGLRLPLAVGGGVTLPCSAQASHYGGFSYCRARTLAARVSVVIGTWADKL